MHDYRRIHAWRRAHALSIAVHEVGRGFGRAGYATLRNQLIRAADSIPANIVEGCAAASKRDFARFLEIAIKSAAETEYHLLKALAHEQVGHEEWQRLSGEAVEVRKMLEGYRRKVLATAAEEATTSRPGA